jgi:hypothetical protein
VEDHTVLFGEERFTNVAPMEEAKEVCSKEKTRMFSCINVAPMEEVWEANLEDNTRIFNDLKEGVLSTIVRSDEKMEKGVKNVPCMKIMEWHGRKCELVNHVGKIIVEGKIVICDPTELVLDNNLSETKVRVTILSWPKKRS